MECITPTLTPSTPRLDILQKLFIEPLTSPLLTQDYSQDYPSTLLTLTFTEVKSYILDLIVSFFILKDLQGYLSPKKGIYKTPILTPITSRLPQKITLFN